MNYQWYDFVGNVGVFIILLAYLLLQMERLGSRSLTYSVMNGVGALLIIVSLCYAFNLSAFVIEFFWLLISIFGMIRVLSARRRGLVKRGRDGD